MQWIEDVKGLFRFERVLLAILVGIGSVFVSFVAYAIVDHVTGRTVITQGTVTDKQFSPAWDTVASEIPLDDKGSTMYVPGIHYDATWNIKLDTRYGTVELSVSEAEGDSMILGQGMMLRLRIGGKSHQITSAYQQQESQ